MHVGTLRGGARLTVHRSRLYATDLYQTAFAMDPMNAEVGRKYRRSILEPGSSILEAKTLETFLGRMPNPEAHYKELQATIS